MVTAVTMLPVCTGAGVLLVESMGYRHSSVRGLGASSTSIDYALSAAQHVGSTGATVTGGLLITDLQEGGNP